MRRLALALAALAVVAPACGGGADRVVVAAGTTLVDSGFLDAVVDAYVHDTGADRPSVVGRSSREAIALGSSGDADLLVTHEPIALYEFLTDHPDAIVEEPFISRFVVVGPGADASGAASAPEHFARIAESGSPFVSRDDGSGTHAKELAIWTAAGVDPSGNDWYTRAGAGMGATLLIASDRGATTLAELGAFLSADDTLDLVEVELTDRSGLENPYQATVVDPSGSPGAMSVLDWLMSERGRAAISEANWNLFGSEVYEVP